MLDDIIRVDDIEVGLAHLLHRIAADIGAIVLQDELSILQLELRCLKRLEIQSVVVDHINGHVYWLYLVVPILTQ